MRELTKSIGSFSWAMTLFGARQMLNALQPSRAAGSFDAVTRETEKQLGDVWRSTFQAGDRMQRSLVDLTVGMFTLQALDPRQWTEAASQMAGGAADAARRTTEAAAGAVARPRVPPPGRSAAGPVGPGGAAGAAPGAGGPGWGPMG